MFAGSASRYRGRVAFGLVTHGDLTTTHGRKTLSRAYDIHTKGKLPELDMAKRQHKKRRGTKNVFVDEFLQPGVGGFQCLSHVTHDDLVVHEIDAAGTVVGRDIAGMDEPSSSAPKQERPNSKSSKSASKSDRRGGVAVHPAAREKTDQTISDATSLEARVSGADVIPWPIDGVVALLDASASALAAQTKSQQANDEIEFDFRANTRVSSHRSSRSTKTRSQPQSTNDTPPDDTLIFDGRWDMSLEGHCTDLKTGQVYTLVGDLFDTPEEAVSVACALNGSRGIITVPAYATREFATFPLDRRQVVCCENTDLRVLAEALGDDVLARLRGWASTLHRVSELTNPSTADSIKGDDAPVLTEEELDVLAAIVSSRVMLRWRRVEQRFATRSGIDIHAHNATRRSDEFVVSRELAERAMGCARRYLARQLPGDAVTLHIHADQDALFAGVVPAAVGVDSGFGAVKAALGLTSARAEDAADATPGDDARSARNNDGDEESREQERKQQQPSDGPCVVECVLERRGLPHDLVVDDITAELTSAVAAVGVKAVEVVGADGEATRVVLDPSPVALTTSGVIPANSVAWQRVRIVAPSAAAVTKLQHRLSAGAWWRPELRSEGDEAASFGCLRRAAQRRGLLPRNTQETVTGSIAISESSVLRLTAHESDSPKLIDADLEMAAADGATGEASPASTVAVSSPASSLIEITEEGDAAAANQLEAMAGEPEHALVWVRNTHLLGQEQEAARARHEHKARSKRGATKSSGHLMDTSDQSGVEAHMNAPAAQEFWRDRRYALHDPKVIHRAPYIASAVTQWAAETSLAGTRRRREASLREMLRTAQQQQAAELGLCDLTIGDNWGFDYKVTLRHVLDEEKASADAAARSLKTSGFLNYFGPSRFTPPTRRGAHVGRHLLSGEFRAAAHVLVDTGEEETFDTVDVTARASLTSLQRAVVHALQVNGQSEEACKRAFLETLGPRACRTYVHEFLSSIWNDVLSQRVRRVGPRNVIAGDIVRPRAAATDGALVQSAPTRPVFVTDADVRSKRYTVHDVVLPIPGAGIVLPDNESASIWVSTLKTHGIDVHPELGRWTAFDADGNALKERFMGGYRYMAEVPTDLSWVFRQDAYNAPLSHFEEFVQDTRRSSAKQSASASSGPEGAVDSKATTASASEKKNLKAEDIGGAVDIRRKLRRESVSWARSPDLALELSFKLPASAYPAMLVRELCKLDTHSAMEIKIPEHVGETLKELPAHKRQHMAKVKAARYTKRGAVRGLKEALLEARIFRSEGLRTSLLPTVRSLDSPMN